MKNNLKKTFLLVISLLAALTACGQGRTGQATGSTMEFPYEIWDFGRIPESGGPVSHTFNFTNAGPNAFVIEHISVSCGCTTPTFSRNPIKPGEQGFITLTYDPMNRPGVFLQEVHIRSNGGANNNILKIKGQVVPRDRTVEESHPFETRSGLRLTGMSSNFNYIGQGQTSSMTIGYANPTDKPMRLSFDIAADSKILKVSAPETVCAGCKGDITITYTIPGGTYGRFVDRIYPIVDGTREYMPLSVTALAVDTDQRTGTTADIRPVYHNFGEVARGAPLRHSFNIKNTGRQPMVVRWVSHRPELETDLSEGVVIEAGREKEFYIALDSRSAQAGAFNSAVSFIVNDPVRPFREVRVMANLL